MVKLSAITGPAGAFDWTSAKYAFKASSNPVVAALPVMLLPSTMGYVLELSLNPKLELASMAYAPRPMSDRLVAGLAGSGIKPIISIVPPVVSRQTTAPGMFMVCPVVEDTRTTVPKISFP